MTRIHKRRDDPRRLHVGKYLNVNRLIAPPRPIRRGTLSNVLNEAVIADGRVHHCSVERAFFEVVLQRLLGLHLRNLSPSSRQRLHLSVRVTVLSR